ncbi:MAG: head GIN domain-containing protein [Pseudomonadota bacterium]
MTRAALLIAAAALAGPAALAETRAYDLSGFDRLSVSRAIDVEFSQGSAFSVEVEEEDGDFSGIALSVEDGALRVTRPDAAVGRRNSTSIEHRFGQRVVKINGKIVPNYVVRVTAPSLAGLTASSSARIRADGVDADLLSAKASSSGDIELSGACRSLIVQASSSGDVNASGLVCGAIEADAGSSGDIRLMADGGDVSVKAASSSDVVLAGLCGRLYVTASSSADVKADDMSCATSMVRASSSADVSVRVSEAVDAKASSSADVDVYGAPADVDIDENSGGDVNMKRG